MFSFVISIFLTFNNLKIDLSKDTCLQDCFLNEKCSLLLDIVL